MVKNISLELFFLFLIAFSITCESSKKISPGIEKSLDIIHQSKPWNGIHIGINSKSIDRLIDAVNTVIPKLGINLLIVEVDYNFEYESYPQLRGENPINRTQARNLISACNKNGIRIIPQFQSLGHQSWSKKTTLY